MDEIGMTSKYVEYRAETEDGSKWEHRVWRVNLKYQGRRATFRYMTGMGITGGPELSDVLESLVLDASVEDSSGYADWASEFSSHEDEWPPRATYNACLRHAERCRRLFGTDYDEFLETEWDS